MASRRKLRVGVVRFPGSNCDFDTIKFFERFGHKAFFVWYKDKKIPPLDLLVLPGGFAFGDRSYTKATGVYSIDPGALALASPVMKPLRVAAKRGVPILGICNGFQILVKAKLLPGKLERNDSEKFFCDYTSCKVGGTSFFNDQRLLNKTFSIPVAHGYGNYRVSKADAARLEKNKQIFLTYTGRNPNGSVANIAGVTNKEKTIFGMMPHPERSPHAAHFMRAIEHYVKA